MRAKNEKRKTPDLEQQSISVFSVSSTATTKTLSSSHGLQYERSWCEPPRCLKRQQDDIGPHLQHGSIKSNEDLGAEIRHTHKPSVRISAWRLVKLDPKEVIFATKALKSSIHMQPVKLPDETNHSTSDCNSITEEPSNQFKSGLREICELGETLECSRSLPPHSGSISSNEDNSLSSGISTPDRNDSAVSLELKNECPNMAPDPDSLYGKMPSPTCKYSGSFKVSSLPISHATLVSQSPCEHPAWICTTPASDRFSIVDGNDGLQRSHIVMGAQPKRSSNLKGVYWDCVARQFHSVPENSSYVKVSSLLSQSRHISGRGTLISKNTPSPASNTGVLKEKLDGASMFSRGHSTMSNNSILKNENVQMPGASPTFSNSHKLHKNNIIQAQEKSSRRGAPMKGLNPVLVPKHSRPQDKSLPQVTAS